MDTAGSVSRRTSFADLAAAVLSAGRGPRASTVVAIDGPSGAGKTTFAARLGAALRAPVLSMDDLYPGWDGLEAGARHLVSDVLGPLAAGRAARFRTYDWRRGVPGGWRELGRPTRLVVEGAGAGARAAAPYLALLVWIETPPPVRKERALSRDGDAYRPHWVRWQQQEIRHYVAEGTRERADVTVDGGPPEEHDPDRYFRQVVAAHPAPAGPKDSGGGAPAPPTGAGPTEGGSAEGWMR